MCGKACYDTRKEARAAARRYAARSPGRKQYPYFCRYCGSWHLSSMHAGEAKRINRERKQRRREQWEARQCP